MTLLNPLFLVPAILSFGAFLLLRSAGTSDDWRRVASSSVLGFLRPGGVAGGLNFPLLALGLVFAGLASPSLRADNTNAYALDEGIIVLVDVSKSMDLKDIAPTRISAARAASLQISAQVGARPAALIAYAGDAYLLEPFAVDRRQFDAFAAELAVGLVPQEGSNLERALALARTVIDESGVGRARLIIVSDGGGFGGEIGFIARRLAERRHRVDIVMTADPATTTPVAADIEAMAKTAQSGNGAFVGTGPGGAVDLTPLHLAGNLLDQGETRQLALRSTDWRNLSHFILILAIPAMLLTFRQVRR